MKLNRLSLCAGLGLLLCQFGIARTYTNTAGRTIEATFVSATETEVTLKLKRTGKSYTLPFANLSAKDINFIAEKRAEQLKLEELDINRQASKRALQKLVEFAEANRGKKVGNGECWTLVNHAYNETGISRPGADQRVWGRLVDWENEEIQPGDVLELRAATFTNGMKTGPAHTALVIKGGKLKGQMTVLHQNWGGGNKAVAEAIFDLSLMTVGEAMIYRYEITDD